MIHANFANNIITTGCLLNKQASNVELSKTLRIQIQFQVFVRKEKILIPNQLSSLNEILCSTELIQSLK